MTSNSCDVRTIVVFFCSARRFKLAITAFLVRRSRPRNSIVPLEGSSARNNILIKVVLPAPLIPRIPRISPLWISKERSSVRDQPACHTISVHCSRYTSSPLHGHAVSDNASSCSGLHFKYSAEYGKRPALHTKLVVLLACHPRLMRLHQDSTQGQELLKQTTCFHGVRIGPSQWPAGVLRFP